VDVHRGQVGVQLVEGPAHLLAAAVDRRGQRVEGGAEVAGAHRTQEREEPAEHPAELDGGGDPLGGHHRAVLDPEPAPATGGDERDEPLAEQGRRQDLGRHLLRHRRREVRLEPQLDHRLVAGLVDVAHLADEHPVEPHVAVLGELQPRPVGLQRDRGEVGERLVVDRQGQRHEQPRHGEVRDPGDQELAALSRVVVATHHDEHRRYPVILTVVVLPQIAKLRKKSATTTVTIEERIARPTATPTPAGPPLAL
jgi:hypothetical protein